MTTSRIPPHVHHRGLVPRKAPPDQIFSRHRRTNSFHNGNSNTGSASFVVVVIVSYHCYYYRVAVVHRRILKNYDRKFRTTKHSGEPRPRPLTNYIGNQKRI